MNSVQTVTQKQCTESKNWLIALSAQPWPACAPRCAQAALMGRPRCACAELLAVSWPGPRPCCSFGWPCSWPRRPCRWRAPVPCRGLAGRVVAHTRAVSQDTPNWPALSGHDTLLVLRPISYPSQPQPVTIQNLYRDTLSLPIKPQPVTIQLSVS